MWPRIAEQYAPEGESSDGGAAVAEAPAVAPAAAPAASPAAANPAPAAPAAAPAAAAPSAAPAPATAEPVKGIWPENWRETVSKEDAKVLSRLQRYASPEAAIQALIEAQNRISKGELKPVLGKNATPEQLKEWREAHGIPEAPDKYDLGDIGKQVDPEILTEVLKDAHATNQTPDQVKATLTALGRMDKLINEKRAEADVDYQAQAEDTLRQEWGGEFRRNINLIHGLLDSTANKELKDLFLNGRMGDGKPIGSNPDMLRMMLSLALIQNPTGTVVAGGHADPMKGVEEEIAKIETTMKTNRRAYNNDDKMQARYRELLEAREKLKPRGV